MCYSTDIYKQLDIYELPEEEITKSHRDNVNRIYANSTFNLRSQIPILLPSENKIKTFFWGLVPRWFDKSKHKQNRPYHNARIETIDKLSSFRTAVKDKNFCIILIAGFYEPNQLKNSRDVRFTLKNSPIIKIAGLWERWDKNDTVTMVTCPGNEIINKYHKAERMPLILHDEQIEPWQSGELDYFQHVYTPIDSDLLIVEKV